MNASDIVSDPGYRELKEHVLAHTGLAFYHDKDADLASRLAHRFEACKASSCAAYLRILNDKAHGHRETDALVAELTIGETYFFRQREHFDALRLAVFPDLIERNCATRRLRIWSAGAATGAEAYSVALLLQLELADRIFGWDISILATDINRVFLERGRAGRFDDWTLRGLPEDLKNRCFSREHRHWLLRPEFRRWVRFEYNNLASGPAPATHDATGFDLILCRNVMIYFSRERIRATAERLYGALAEGGWLLVGHAEHNTEVFENFRTVSTNGAILYQKPVGRRPSPVWTSQPPEKPALLPDPTPVPLPVPAPPTESREQPELQSVDLHEVRALADRGQWREAVSRCKALLDSEGLNAAAHFTYGLILEHTGAPDEAEQYLRRAVYLDRNFALAHYHLGLSLQRKRATARARRAFANTLQILEVRPAAEQLEHGDGITVAELRDLAKMHLELLEKK